MTADAVQDNERQSFLDWRRDLATLQVDTQLRLICLVLYVFYGKFVDLKSFRKKMDFC